MQVWRIALVGAVAASVFGVSLAGAARSGDFRDEFTTFDVRQWVKIDRPFGHGTLESANVAVANGFLGVKLPAGTLNGGEMRSTGLLRFGSYRTRMKVANAPTSLTAFFLYKRPDFAQELDIEIFNDTSRRVWFSTYSGGAQTHTIEKQLPFDATADFHEYAIEYDPGAVRFIVDGVEMQSWSTGVPRSAMYLYVNAWFPFWLAGERPATDRFTTVDWIEYASR